MCDESKPPETSLSARVLRVVLFMLVATIIFAILALIFEGCRPIELPGPVYVLSYQGNGASGGAVPAAKSYAPGEAARVAGPGSLEKAGYRFLGWKTSAAGAVAGYWEGSLVELNADLSLYAHWSPEGEGDRQFYATDLENNQWYPVWAALLAEGAHSLIYADKNLPTPVTTLQAQLIVAEYEANIHGKITGAFGDIKDMDRNGKVIFLLLDIRDGYTPGGAYTGGYFHSYHMYAKASGPYSNEADMLFLDVFPTVAGGPGFYATMAHELQHLINFSETAGQGRPPKATWIDEGLSTAAEYLYAGDPSERILYYVADPYGSMGRGNNFFVWNGYWESASAGVSQDPVGNYATAYLFFQWLRIQAGNGRLIYKDIIASGFGDYRAVTEAAAERIGGVSGNDDQRWQTLLQSWMLSNYAYTGTGLLGYGKDPVFLGLITEAMETVEGLLNKGHDGEAGYPVRVDTPAYSVPVPPASYGLYPGEGLFSAITDGPFTPAEGSGPHIRYAALDTADAVSTAEPYNGDVLLSYNANTSFLGAAEKGYLAATVSASRMAAVSSAQAEDTPGRGGLPAFMLPGHPVDVRVNPDGSLGGLVTGRR